MIWVCSEKSWLLLEQHTCSLLASSQNSRGRRRFQDRVWVATTCHSLQGTRHFHSLQACFYERLTHQYMEIKKDVWASRKRNHGRTEFDYTGFLCNSHTFQGETKSGSAVKCLKTGLRLYEDSGILTVDCEWLGRLWPRSELHTVMRNCRKYLIHCYKVLGRQKILKISRKVRETWSNDSWAGFWPMTLTVGLYDQAMLTKQALN